MPDPPRDESLTDLDLDHGIPVHPQARATEEKLETGTGFHVEGASWQTVRDWYLGQMRVTAGCSTRAGWGRLRGGGQRLRFDSAAWTWAELFPERSSGR